MSPLARDYMYAYERVDEYFNGDFHHLETFRNQTDKAQSREIDRESLGDVLMEQNRAYGCGKQTVQNIERLSRDRVCAILTGQQAGLFSGPLYTIYKALTAIKLAEYLNQNCHGSYVPVFWVASDDHDFAEVDHIHLLDKDNQIQKIRYDSPLSHLRISACRVELTSEISGCIQRLDDLTRGSEFKPRILSHLQDAYRAGRMFTDAFARWMTCLFRSYGLVLVDASHPGLKKMGKPVFAQEISEHSPSTVQALASSDKLGHAGYKTQVRLHEGILNLFFAEKERHAIRSKGNGFFIKEKERSFSKNELLALVEKKPEWFSPNVLLRPIYQDILFPTVAYVGGQGEIAYFAQMKGVYERFGLSMPVIYPRKSLTLLEKNINSVLDDHGLSVRHVWEDGDRIIGKAVKKQISASIDRVFRRVSSRMEQALESVKKEFVSFDPALKKSVDLASRKVDQQIKFLEQKILRAAKKRNETTTRQLYRAVNNLYPGNSLQERMFNIAPYLIKYDYRLLDVLYRSIEMENFDHQVIHL